MENVKSKVGVAQKIVRVTGIVLCVILIPILICNTVLIFKGVTNPDKVPSIFGISPLIVLSGSMENDQIEPDIRTGDLIFVKETAASELEAGDIIAFRSGTSVVTHRIVRVEEEDGERLFRTKGDNPQNDEDIEPVEASKVVGKYFCKLNGMGDFAMFMQTPVGMLVFIGVPILAFVAYDLLRRRFAAKAEGEKNAALEAELKRLREIAGEAQVQPEQDKQDAASEDNRDAE